MATTDCSTFPVKNQAFRLHFCIKAVSTANPLTGGLTGLVAQVSKDGATFASTTSTPVEIGTSGYGVLDLSASEMNANGILVRVAASNVNAVEFAAEIRPVVLTEGSGHWLDQTVKRVEQAWVQLSAFFFNKHTLTQNAESVYARDNSTVIVSGSVSGLTNDTGTVTRNKQS